MNSGTLLFLYIPGLKKILWPTKEINAICRDNHLIANISTLSICQHKCETDQHCNGICYPRFNGYTKACYLCFGDEEDVVPAEEDIMEAVMEFKKRPIGIIV